MLSLLPCAATACVAVCKGLKEMLESRSGKKHATCETEGTGVPLWCSGLRTWHWYNYGIGCSCSSDSIPGSGTSMCRKRENKTKQNKTEIADGKRACGRLCMGGKSLKKQALHAVGEVIPPSNFIVWKRK